MPDRGAKYADKKIAYIDRKLRQTYKTAEVELSRKLNAFNKKFAAKDKEKQKQLAEGKISKQQYKDWLTGQVFQKERFETQIKQIQQVMYHHNEYAADIVNNSRFDVFAENYYAEAFKANWIIQGVSWDIYNTQAIQRLLEDEPDLLPKWKIDQEKDYDWNYQKVNNIVKQGIIQGEGVEDITKRLCEDLSTMNENRMRMFARTAITGAQNAGRQAQMEQAADMGIDVEKRWIATPDNRTRDSHRLMDGEEVPYNEEFSNGLEYPGDPAGDPAEVYNCRCTMQSVYPKYEDRSKQWREDVEIDGQSYEEWKEEARERIEEKRNIEDKSEEQQRLNTGLLDDTREKMLEYSKEIGEHDKRIEELADKYSELYTDSLMKYGTDEYNDIVKKMEEIESEISIEREKISELKNDRDRYLNSDGKELLIEAFGGIDKKHSIDEDALSVNKITGDDRTLKNCGSCCLAYDARRRGIDCQAELTYGVNNNVIESWWSGLKMHNVTSYYPSDAKREIEDVAESWGEGARGIIEIGTSVTTGHYIMFEVRNGRCIFVDAQSGIVYADHVFDIAVYGDIKYGRTDDKQITKNAISYLRGGAVEQD